jgi:integrase
VVKIYAPASEGKGFTVSYYHRGARVREARNDYAAAKQLALLTVAKMAQGELDVLTLRDQDRMIYLRATETLAPTGRPLDAAAAEYAQAVKLLNGEPLLDAVRGYLANRTRPVQPKAVAAVVDELLKSKRNNGRAKLYLTDLRLRLSRFADAFHCPLGSIGPVEIEQFLNSLKVAPRTRNNFRRTIGTLYHFAKVRGYVAQSHTGVTQVEKASNDLNDIEIFTPDELTALLRAAPKPLVPCLAIGAFAGVRSEEIKRLDWSDFKWDEGYLVIRAAKAKNRVARHVPITETLKLWLSPFRRESGPVCAYINLGNQFLKLAQAAKTKWVRNGLRHSYISYRVAIVMEVPKVALECGNSPKMVQQHYLHVVSKTQAEQWFAVTPEAVRQTTRPGQANPSGATDGANGKIVDISDLVFRGDERNRHAAKKCRRPAGPARTPLDQSRPGGSLPGDAPHHRKLDGAAGAAVSEVLGPNRPV